MADTHTSKNVPNSKLKTHREYISRFRMQLLNIFNEYRVGPYHSLAFETFKGNQNIIVISVRRNLRIVLEFISMLLERSFVCFLSV